MRIVEKVLCWSVCMCVWAAPWRLSEYTDSIEIGETLQIFDDLEPSYKQLKRFCVENTITNKMKKIAWESAIYLRINLLLSKIIPITRWSISIILHQCKAFGGKGVCVGGKVKLASQTLMMHFWIMVYGPQSSPVITKTIRARRTDDLQLLWPPPTVSRLYCSLI